jgi:hypothetical protein
MLVKRKGTVKTVSYKFIIIFQITDYPSTLYELRRTGRSQITS